MWMVTGIMATPRTVGRLPKARTLPALPLRLKQCKTLEDAPKEEIFNLGIRKNHPDFDFNNILAPIC